MVLSYLQAETAAGRQPYSIFDLLAGLGTGFLANMCMTVVVPVALSSAESRNHPSPLTGSGGVAAATSLGMSLSVVLMYPWPEHVMDSKGPFYVFAVMLLVGNLAFLLVEVLEWPHFLLLACRVLMSLGFGAGFAAKRRAGLEPNVRRREYLFMLFELSASVGMASGPLLTGFLALAWPEEATLVPPVQMSIFGALFLVALCGCPLETPFTYTLAGADADAAPPPAAPAAPPAARELSEATPLVMGAKGLVPKGDPSDPAVAAAAAPPPPPPLWVSATVQSVCLLFGIGRNFLKFGFESAMVVVYDRQFGFSEGSAGVLAGMCALSSIVSIFVYKGVCVSRFSTATLLLIAELLAITSALCMIATAATLPNVVDEGYTLAPHKYTPPRDAATRADVFAATAYGYADAAHDPHVSGEAVGGAGLSATTLIALTVGASLLFYPAMYVGAALGNSHPLQFAQPLHPLLSRSAMVAQQELLQTTVGKGLGMLFCRVALGDPPRVASLGAIFLLVMVVQAIALAIGWDPPKTLACFALVTSGRRGVAPRRQKRPVFP